MKKKLWSFFLCFVADKKKGLWFSLSLSLSLSVCISFLRQERERVVKESSFPLPARFTRMTLTERIFVFFLLLHLASSSLSSLECFFFNSFDLTIIHTPITCVCLSLSRSLPSYQILEQISLLNEPSNISTLLLSLSFDLTHDFCKRDPCLVLFYLFRFFVQAWMEISWWKFFRDWWEKRLTETVSLSLFILFVGFDVNFFASHFIQRVFLRHFCITDRHCNLNNLCLFNPFLMNLKT